jgi:diguanylate cyclase (GGDEF)-like protein
MTDGGAMAVVTSFRRMLFSIHGAVVLAAVLALIIGFFVGSPVGRIICFAIAVAGGGYGALLWWRARQMNAETDEEGRQELHRNNPEVPMKKLLFDDYQSSGGKYLVKEVEDEEKRVEPSTKTVRHASVSPREELVREMEVLDFFDLETDAPLNDVEPKSEFHSLLNKVLLVVKDVLFAHTVAFFWINREKQLLVLESMATDSKGFSAERRYPFGEHLGGQVATSGKPQMVGRVTAASEKELLPYYASPAGVKSALGVPVFYLTPGKDIEPVGVIVADCKAEDAWGQETLTLLGRFTKLVSALVKSYTDKYDLLLDSELLSSLRRLQDRVKSDASEATIVHALMDEMNRLANWDCLTIAMYADDRHGWALQKVVNKTGEPYVAPDQPVAMEGSIVGAAIKSNAVQAVDDLALDERARFDGGENIERRGSFVCIPISSYNRCYGALTLESRKKANFSGNEVETLYRLVENAAGALEVVYMNDLVKDYVGIDHLTGAMTRKYFLKKLEEEVLRADEHGDELAFVSIAVDDLQGHQARYGTEGVEAIISEAARLIRVATRPFDVVGRQEQDHLGVLLVNTTASDAYLWGEKLRKLVAGHVMTVGGKSFSVTLSAGVCGLSKGMDAAGLQAGTLQVLGKAIEHGGNMVRVF